MFRSYRFFSHGLTDAPKFFCAPCLSSVVGYALTSPGEKVLLVSYCTAMRFFKVYSVFKSSSLSLLPGNLPFCRFLNDVCLSSPYLRVQRSQRLCMFFASLTALQTLFGGEGCKFLKYICCYGIKMLLLPFRETAAILLNFSCGLMSFVAYVEFASEEKCEVKCG